MNRIIASSMSALEVIEQELGEQKSDDVVKALEYLKRSVGAVDIFDEREIEIARKVKELLKAHKIKIPNFYYIFLTCYSSVRNSNYTPDRMVHAIIVMMDRLEVRKGNKPFTVQVFSENTEKFKTLLGRAADIFLFFEDLRKADESEFRRIRSCGEVASAKLKEYIDSLS